jgi:hypothetical protein
MALPDVSTELTRAQYEFYKSAGRLAKLWYALTVIGLILWMLALIGTCVAGILSAGTVTLFFQSLMQQYGN